MPLCKILGAAKSHGRYLVLAEIILDGEPFERCERPHDEVDLVALNQFNGFCLRSRRHARGVGDDKFDGLARKLEVLVFQKAANPLLKVNASGREPAGFHGHQSDLDWFLLRDGRFAICPIAAAALVAARNLRRLIFLATSSSLGRRPLPGARVTTLPSLFVCRRARRGPAEPAVKPRLRTERQFW